MPEMNKLLYSAEYCGIFCIIIGDTAFHISQTENLQDLLYDQSNLFGGPGVKISCWAQYYPTHQTKLVKLKMIKILKLDFDSLQTDC